ncbi:MAG: dephospho-CoA kinase [Acidimicrobiia bacterium]|nr:dephospho-CoA kinase [Acidimicrobiia bacterium]
MLLVGLTGGIGSGKSTVAALLRQRGAVVVDADVIARQVVEPKTPALAALVDRFGEQILGSNGKLDRAKLAELAFATEESRRALEAITHPAINEEFTRQMLAAPPDAIVICDVPLLAESDQARNRGYPVVIVVESPIEVRLDRLEQRGITREDAWRRISAQASDEERRELATILIDNSGDLSALTERVGQVATELEAIRVNSDQAH